MVEQTVDRVNDSLKTYDVPQFRDRSGDWIVCELPNELVTEGLYGEGVMEVRAENADHDASLQDF